jgi:ABC-type multidrug transport system ATPase subunit
MPISKSTAIGRAAKAGLEDPVLEACLSAFVYLARGDAEMLGVFTRYVEESIGVFLPPERTRLLIRVFLTEATPPDRVDPPEQAAQRAYLFITLREAVLKLPPAHRSAALAEIDSWPWCADILASARAFLDESEHPAILDFAPWPCTPHKIGLIHLPAGLLRLLHHDGHYFARHSATSTTISVNKTPWPPAQTLWLKPSDQITVGNHQLGIATARFFRSSAGETGFSCLHLHEQQIILNASPEGSVARIENHNGSVLTPTASGNPIRLNGQPVESPVPLLPGDRLSIGDVTVPLAKLLQQSRSPNTKHRWTIQLDDITLVFPDGSTGIDGLTLALQSGDLVAVMGPSGCGKSTLMSLLTGEISPTRGKIRFTSSHNRRPSFALVPQDDIVFPELTVMENLRYAAALRGRPFSSATDAELLPILQSIGLAEKKDLRVGSIVDKVLSGGQRKRLNIGLELTATPDGLLLDEPTSGLSSADATEIMRLLRARADENILALAVIHQPSQEVFDLFDKVIILDVGGRLAFFGPPSEAIRFFQQHSAHRQSGPESILETLGGKRTTLDGGTARRVYDPDFWKMRFSHIRDRYAPPLVTGEFSETTRQPNSRRSPLRNLGLITHREFKRKLKEWRSFLASTSFSILLALIIGWVGRSTRIGEPYSFANNQNLPASLFLAVVLVSFLALSASVQEVVKDNAFRLRERLLGISPVIWLLGKIPWLALSLAFQTALVTVCIFGLIRLPVAWFGLWVVLTLTAWCSASLGLLVSSLPRMNERVALASVPLLLVPQLILCGADPFHFKSVAHLHWPFKIPVETAEYESATAPWPSRFMPSRWAYQAAVCTLRDVPELDGAFDEKTLLKTYNVAKKNAPLWQQDPPSFLALMSEKLGRPVDADSLRRSLLLTIRAGYRSPAEAAAALGGILPDAANTRPDLLPKMNITFQDYARRSFPHTQYFMGRELPIRQGSLRIVLFMSGVLIILAAFSLTFNRRLFNKP